MRSSRPPFSLSGVAQAVSDVGRAYSPSRVGRALRVDVPQKIRKSGPFKLPLTVAEPPYFSRLLSDLLGNIAELPDFSDDESVAVMSDFGGEHSSACFYTYSFLFLAYSKVGPFSEKVRDLREKHGLLDPYSEFAYKELKHGPRSRALGGFLRIVDSLVHGSVITLAIDKRIDTVFGWDKKPTYDFMARHLAENNLGVWEGAASEKLFRVCHALAAFTAILVSEDQKFLWYSDNDSINENGSKRDFADTQKAFQSVLAVYMRKQPRLLGFGKSFADRSHLDDLLSIPDLAAGVVQDLLQAQRTGSDIPGGPEKVAVMRWIATPARFLSKVTLQISRMPDGGIGTGVVAITPRG